MHRSTFVLAIAAAAGAGTMTVELAAVRLIAPWFGTSSGVWTNVIGVILLALALGYLLGARLSRRAAPMRQLGLALLCSAALTAWLPALTPHVAEYFVPRGLALDEIAALMTWGSLAASIVLFLPAALALGCVGPLAVETLQGLRGGHAGDAGGRVLCFSTLGSLVGTFGTTHVLLPEAGLTRTFLGASLLLALAGLAALCSTKKGESGDSAPPGGSSGRSVGGGAAGVVVAGLFFSRLEMPNPPDGSQLLEEHQSAYQSIRVFEQGAGPTRMRRLAVNESLDSFQSVWSPEPGLLPPGYYYNLFALPPWWAQARGEWRLMTLGLGAGSTVRVMEGAMPSDASLISVGVEIDPAVAELGRTYFELEQGTPDRIVLTGVDARAALTLDLEPFDQIVLDAFANNMEVPAHLATVEFFQELRASLKPQGWLVINAAGFGLQDPVVSALADTLAHAWERGVLIVRVPFARNCVLFARPSGDLPEPGTSSWRLTGDSEPAPAISALLPLLELPGAWRRVAGTRETGASPLTDDLNPIDRLQRESIRVGRRAWLDEL
ncbi:MAG: spermidine synthase [Chlamydiales bacterium]|jgi:spermidine synthase